MPVEHCPLCNESILDTDAVVWTDDGWTHAGCLDEDELDELVQGYEDLGGEL